MWRAFKRVARVAAVSNAVLDLVRELGLPTERGFVAHPAIASIWHQQPSSDRKGVRERWGAADSDVILLTIARVVPDKGQTDVIAALARLPDGVRQRTLYVLVGRGPTGYVQSVAAAATVAGVRLVLLGEISDREAVQAADAADVFVMPSKRTPTRLEGFGIAYIEAGSRGLPSLARATGGAGEAVRAGETGIVLPEAAGTDAVASALLELIEDADLRNQLGTNARRYAREFTWERHAARVYEAFA
jgi:glycosyltransferase involved in cell wall biosynthesis